MKRVKKYKIRWFGTIVDETFTNIIFDQLVVKNAKISNINFQNIHFKNCHLGFDSDYFDSSFINCKFYGRYSSLGRRAKFKNCRFENCNFVGIDLFRGQHFIDCCFSGTLKNILLNDKHKIVQNNETLFINCNLSKLLFDNVSIYGSGIFNNCILPEKGIRLFRNNNNELIDRAEEVCWNSNSIDSLKSEIIFNRALRGAQNPIILDKLFLDSFFKNEENAKDIFDEIVNEFEMFNLK